jgi:hypothetical protein
MKDYSLLKLPTNHLTVDVKAQCSNIRNMTKEHYDSSKTQQFKNNILKYNDIFPMGQR